MSRTFLAAFVACLVAALAGCGTDPPRTTATPDAPTSTDAAGPDGADVPAAPDGALPDGGTGFDVPADHADALDAPADVSFPADVTGAPDSVGDGPACPAARTLCGGACVDTSADPANCGACGRACPPAPSGLRAACAASACGVGCAPGFELRGGACAFAAPALRAPLSTSRVTSRRPRMRWTVPGGPVPATVRLCRDRALTAGCLSLAASEASAVPAADLAPGAWFWRVERSEGGMAASSATWEFFVGARSAPVDTSWGSVPDFNGDGLADAMAGSQGGADIPVHHGAVPGPAAEPSYRLANPRDPLSSYFGVSLASAGDVNGDGFGDAAVGSSGHVYVFLGGPSGLARPHAQDIARTGTVFFGTYVAPAGDVNGDGFGDVLALAGNGVLLYYGGRGGLDAGAPAFLLGDEPGSACGLDIDGDGFGDIAMVFPRGTRSDGALHLFRGSPTGPAGTPDARVNGPYNDGFGSRIADAGDVNGDGFGDLVVGSAAPSNGHWRVYLGGPSLPTAPSLETASHGGAVSGAGDVNGDGFGDVVAGDDGNVSLYLGSAGGLAAAPASTIRGMGVFGRALAAAGDVNGDGYQEVAVGGNELAIVYEGTAEGLGREMLVMRPASPGFGFGFAVAGLDRPWRAPSWLPARPARLRGLGS